MLDMLEELLAITEPFKSQMNSDDYNSWQRISAKTADMRLKLTPTCTICEKPLQTFTIPETNHESFGCPKCDDPAFY